MKIALLQQNYLVCDIVGNATKIIQSALEAKKQGASAALFPQGALCGGPLEMLADSTILEEKIQKALATIATQCPEIEILMGLDEFETVYIAQGVFEILNTDYAQLGNAAVLLGSSRFSHNAPQQRLEELVEEAVNQDLTILWANQVGASTDTIYYGGSMACYPTGEVQSMPLFVEGMMIIDSDNPCNSRAEWGSKEAQIFQALKLGVADYFAKNNFREACVALSGGIDSAVVVALAVEALGADRVRVVMLPSAYSSDHSVADSLEMVRRTGIRSNVIEIEPIFQEALRAMAPVFEGQSSGLAQENMQSRIRLMLTMALSNATGALMLNTSNKSEVAVGYGTLYGDTSGALGVIADLYKCEVYALARYINETCDEPIPQNIIDKEPSAELRPDQRDSDSLPEYPVLDAILYRLVELHQTPQEIIDQDFDSSTVLRTAQMVWNGDFKRHQLPPALRVSGATFGYEYRLPITKVKWV